MKRIISNASTTGQEFQKPSWENTVENIFRQNRDNLLLEFTATPDYRDEKFC